MVAFCFIFNTPLSLDIVAERVFKIPEAPTCYACAVRPEEQESCDSKLLYPRVPRFPFRWTRVTRTLGTRLDIFGLSRALLSRPLVKRNEDPGCEGGPDVACTTGRLFFGYYYFFGSRFALAWRALRASQK